MRQQNYNNNYNNNNKNFQQNYNRKHDANWFVKLSVFIFFILCGVIVFETVALIKPQLVNEKISVLSSEAKYNMACKSKDSYRWNCEKDANREEMLASEIMLVRNSARIALFSLIIMLITVFGFIKLNKKI